MSHEISPDAFDAFFVPPRSREEWHGDSIERKMQLAELEFFIRFQKLTEVTDLESMEEHAYEALFFRHFLMRWMYGVVEGPENASLIEQINVRHPELDALEEFEFDLGEAEISVPEICHE